MKNKINTHYYIMINYITFCRHNYDNFIKPKFKLQKYVYVYFLIPLSM